MNFVKTKPRSDLITNEELFFKLEISDLNLTANFIHASTTDWTFSFHCRFTVFHGDFDGIGIFSLCPTFDTIH